MPAFFVAATGRPLCKVLFCTLCAAPALPGRHSEDWLSWEAGRDYAPLRAMPHLTRLGLNIVEDLAPNLEPLLSLTQASTAARRQAACAICAPSCGTPVPAPHSRRGRTFQPERLTVWRRHTESRLQATDPRPPGANTPHTTPNLNPTLPPHPPTPPPFPRQVRELSLQGLYHACTGITRLTNLVMLDLQDLQQLQPVDAGEPGCCSGPSLQAGTPAQ